MSFFIEQRLIYTHAPAKMKAATASRLRGIVFRLDPKPGEEEYEVPAAPTGPAIGIDAGVAHSAAFAATDGRTGLVSLPVATAGEERTLRRMARTIARRRRGSGRYLQAVLRRQR